MQQRQRKQVDGFKHQLQEQYQLYDEQYQKENKSSSISLLIKQTPLHY